MKGLAAGALLWVLISVAVPGGPVLGLVVGALAAYLILRGDAFDRRLKGLERGAAQTTALPEPTSLPAPAPSAAEPADLEAAPLGPAIDYILETRKKWPRVQIDAELAKKGYPAEIIREFWDGIAEGDSQIAQGATKDARVPQAPPKRPPLISMEDLEALLAGRLLAVAGGLALLVGGIFFMGLAFSRGWIGPEARSVLGLVVGGALFGVGVWFLLRPGNRAREILAHVLLAIGLALITLGLFAATRLYGFVAADVGVGGALVAAAVAAGVAIRARSQLVAGFGLVAVLAAPPVMGASATLLTILFLGTALAGTTVICLYISWRWLPPIAFLLAVPQLASYIAADPNVGIALAALVVFWALNALSAAGEEVRRPSGQLSPTSATLIVANGAFAVWAGFALLSGSLEPWRGLYLVGVAAVHLALGSFFLLRNGERHPFGMLVFGSGVASLTLAVPVQLGASWVPMAWAAEAVALAWVYAQREHIYAGLVAGVLGALTLGHLLVVEYPIRHLNFGPKAGAVPFLNGNGAALAFVILAAGVAIFILRRRAERVGVAGVMTSVLALALPVELNGVPIVAAYAFLTAAALLVERRWMQIPITFERASMADWRTSLIAAGERALYASAGLTGALLLWFAIRHHLPPSRFADGLQTYAPFARSPFFDDGTLVAAIVVAAALIVAFGGGDRRFRWFGCVAAAVTVAYLVPFEAGPAWSIVAWLGLGLALHVLAMRWEMELPLRVIVTYAFGIVVVLEALLVVAAPYRLVVQSVPFPEAALFNGGTLAAAALTATLAARALLPPRDRDARIAGVVAGASAVYLLSIGTVDLFQANLGGSVAVEELRKQGEVALSVLWAVLGVVGFVIGLVRPSATARLFGLGLLAIVTVKVFIVDLAALDVAYRVLSFVALGLLLLGAAYMASRFQPDRAHGPGVVPPASPAHPTPKSPQKPGKGGRGSDAGGGSL